MIKLKKLNKGFKQFLVKTGLFIALFIVIQLILMFYQNIPLPSIYYFILDVDIGKALLLTAMIFFFLSIDKLKKLDEYKFELGKTIIFGILGILSFVGYFFLKAFLISNPAFAVDNILLFYPLKELALILGSILLIISVFGMKFSKYFIKKFKKEIGISIIIFILALFFIIEFQKLWSYFSFFVAKGVYYLLNLTSQATLSFSNNTPVISLNNFIVNIGKPCSGIDSMLMFIFLYVFIAGYDWKILNKKKAMMVFIPGVISVFLLNIIRIYLLLVIGAFISSKFALGFFHTNASMILFLGYFALFWGLLYKWMKKKEFRKENTNKSKLGVIKTFYNKIMSDSLYRNSIYLMLSTFIVSFLGFVFWIINARLFTTEQVGLATTIISSASLIVSIAGLGLGAGLIRYLPKSKRKNQKINTCFTLIALFTIVVSVIFLLIIDFTSPKIHFIKENMILAFIFIIFMIFASLSSLIESVFIAYRNTKYVLIKNSVFSISKLILPFLLVSLGAYGIFSSYMLSMVLGFLTVFIILVYKFNYKPKFAFYDSIIKKIGKYSFGNYVAGFIGSLPVLLLPLIITNVLTPETTAYYYMVMMIASTLFIIPQATSNSLFAEGSYNQKTLKHNIWKSIKIISLLLIPAIIITIFFGKYVLLLFGKSYSSEGYMFLDIMAVSGVFVAVNSVLGSILNIRKRIGAIITRSILSTILVLGLSIFFIKQGYALMGIGYAYLAGQIITAIMFLWVVWKK